MGAIADERVLEQLGLGCECRNGFYGVLRWDRTSGTVTASLQVDCGTAAVADPREVPLPRPVISLALALQLLAEGWEVPKGALAPAILAPDNTWHRPLTTLELARLQGLPAVLNGKPLVLAGKSDRRWREHIGNGIPRDAAEAWGRQLLESLLLSDQGHSFRLLGGDLWVAPDMEVLAS
jgi:site-specific DNA-cytosine methylase